MEELSSHLRALSVAFGREIDPDALESLVRYAELVESWNRRIDLTAARDARTLVEVLVADALVLCDEALVPRDARIVDVGSGAGAPIVPLLVLRPDARATLVEPLRKRVAFLRTVIGALDIAGRARVVEGRIDPRAPRVDGSPFDVALSRATFAPREWLDVGRSLAGSTLVLVAREPLPGPADGSSPLAERAYAIPSTGAPRAIGRFGRAAPSDPRP